MPTGLGDAVGRGVLFLFHMASHSGPAEEATRGEKEQDDRPQVMAYKALWEPGLAGQVAWPQSSHAQACTSAELGHNVLFLVGPSEWL